MKFMPLKNIYNYKYNYFVDPFPDILQRRGCILVVGVDLRTPFARLLQYQGCRSFGKMFWFIKLFFW